MTTYTFTTLNDPSAVNGTDATGINGDGQIVGYYVDGSGNEEGFEFNNGSYIAVNNNNAGYEDVMPLGINNEGNIVGDDKTQGPFGLLQLGFLDSAGAFTQIFGTDDGQTPGYFATGINNQNVIVGYVKELSGPETDNGFIDKGFDHRPRLFRFHRDVCARSKCSERGGRIFYRHRSKPVHRQYRTWVLL